MTDKPKADAPAAPPSDHLKDPMEEAQRKGYFGEVPPGPANHEFSVQSGPESPDAFDQHAQNHDNLKAKMYDASAGKEAK